MLSAGLDSGSVTALAARSFRERGQRLTAFTSVPLFPDEAAAQMPGLLVDEWPLAHENAEFQGNVDHIAIRAESITPLQAIERLLEQHGEPEPGVTNLHWSTALFDEARQRGFGVLLSGQFGNGGVSWAGDPDRVLRALLRGRLIAAFRDLRQTQKAQRRSLLRTAWSTVVRPAQRRRAIRSLRDKEAWLAASGGLLRRDAAERLQLFERIQAGASYEEMFSSARASRMAILLPGVTHAGALWHEVSATTGIEARDPTADVRLLSFCLGVPDDLFFRAEGDRWLLRKAMTGLLPPSVQWNARRGRQSADLLQRFRADAANVRAALARIAASERARSLLDLNTVERLWRTVLDPADAQAVHAVAFAAAALEVGLFLTNND
jgi:asparagine synthase (glutamine-hydrolysing)